jgi:transmembrane sensor
LSEHDSDSILPDAARYVQPKVTEARLERVWSKVDARLPGRRAARRAWGWVGAGVLAAAAVGGLYLLGPNGESSKAAESVLAGAVLETASDSLSMGLLDGSSLTLAQSSRVEVASSSTSGVRLRLKRGRIECEVKPRPEANFVVVADGVEVRVVGTRFSVTAEGDDHSRRVHVEVERGEVEIRSSTEPGEVVRLKAGRSWSQVTKTGPAQPAVSVPVDPVESASVLPKAKPPAEVTDTVAGPRELLEEANDLRRAGNAREAAKRYELLLNQYGSDGRAGLAAFELGRLRMDRLGDMRGAISALERAMTLAPGSGFREDALARVVTANARSGNQAGCKRAKERYLKSYPEGVHREAVLEQCGGP